MDTHNVKNPVTQLWGVNQKRFDDPYDLVALRVPADQDRLSEFILKYFGGLFPVRLFFLLPSFLGLSPSTTYLNLPSTISNTPSTCSNLPSLFTPHQTQNHKSHPLTPPPQATSSDTHSSYIRESSLAKCVAIISSILSAILLFGSIASLYFVHNPYALLGMLGGWTVLFAVSVGWLTNAKRDQVFAATAAYCAVLVVFVSGTLGGAAPMGVAEGQWNCTRVG